MARLAGRAQHFEVSQPHAGEKMTKKTPQGEQEGSLPPLTPPVLTPTHIGAFTTRTVDSPRTQGLMSGVHEVKLCQVQNYACSPSGIHTARYSSLKATLKFGFLGAWRTPASTTISTTIFTLTQTSPSRPQSRSCYKLYVPYSLFFSLHFCTFSFILISSICKLLHMLLQLTMT